MADQITFRANSKAISFYLSLPIFKKPKPIGKIDLDSKTYIMPKKNRKNLFLMYNGIGINSEILRRFKFEYIEVKFENEILRTTKQHFLNRSIPSPFVSDKVDHQRILPLSEWYIPESHEVYVIQEELFA